MKQLTALTAVLVLFFVASPARAQVHDPAPFEQDWTDISSFGALRCRPGDACCLCKKECGQEYDSALKRCNDGPSSGKELCVAESKRHYKICLCGRCAESCNDIKDC